MKKIIYLLIVVVAFSAFYITFKRDLDQFNPLYSEKTSYTVVTGPPSKTEKSRDIIRYRYNLNGYTENGKKTNVTFSAGSPLESGTYVEVIAKGAYTKKWTKVKENEVPEKALQVLSSK